MVDRIEGEQPVVQEAPFTVFEPGDETLSFAPNGANDYLKLDSIIPRLTLVNDDSEELDTAATGSSSQSVSGQNESESASLMVRFLGIGKSEGSGFESSDLTTALRDKVASVFENGGESIRDLVRSTWKDLLGPSQKPDEIPGTGPEQGLSHARRPAWGSFDPTKPTGYLPGGEPSGEVIRRPTTRPFPTEPAKPTGGRPTGDPTGGVIPRPAPRPFPTDPTKPAGGLEMPSGGVIGRPNPRPRPTDTTKPSDVGGAGEATGGVRGRPLPADSTNQTGHGSTDDTTSGAVNDESHFEDGLVDAGTDPIIISDEGPVPDLAEPNDATEAGDATDNSEQTKAAIAEFNNFANENFQIGPVRDMVKEFGRQVLSGDIDAQKLSEMMQTEFPLTKYAVDQTSRAVEKLNELLKPQGIKLDVGFGGSEYHGYQMFDIHLSEITEAGSFQNYLSIEQNGDASSLQIKFNDPELRNHLDRQLREIEPDEAAANLSGYLREALLPN